MKSPMNIERPSVVLPSPKSHQVLYILPSEYLNMSHSTPHMVQRPESFHFLELESICYTSSLDHLNVALKKVGRCSEVELDLYRINKSLSLLIFFPLSSEQSCSFYSLCSR